MWDLPARVQTPPKADTPEDVLDAAVFSCDSAGLALGLAGDNLGGVAGAGEEIQGPVRARLPLKLGKVADADAWFNMIGKQAAGWIANPDIIGYAPDAGIDVGMAGRAYPVWIGPTQGRGDFTDNRLTDQLLLVGFEHDGLPN